jgi:hypothetical protein
MPNPNPKTKVLNVTEPESCWDEHADYPVADWRHEVAEDNTRLGYIDWVNHQQEAAADDC